MCQLKSDRIQNRLPVESSLIQNHRGFLFTASQCGRLLSSSLSGGQRNNDPVCQLSSWSGAEADPSLIAYSLKNAQAPRQLVSGLRPWCSPQMAATQPEHPELELARCPPFNGTAAAGRCLPVAEDCI